MSTALDHYLVRSGEIVDEYAGLEREITRLRARQTALLAERVELMLNEVTPGAVGFDQAERSMLSELATAARLTRYAAGKALSNAHALHQHFPATLAALKNGVVTLAHVDAIVESARHIPRDDPHVLAAYETRVLAYAAEENCPRTRGFAQSVAASLAPQPLLEKHRQAFEERSVMVVDDTATGNSDLILHGPKLLIHAAYDRATQGARAIKNASAGSDEARDTLPGDALRDTRRLDQIRFDLLLDLILTGTPDANTDLVSAIRPTVQVTIAATTLSGRNDAMAELDGHGALDPDIARLLAESAVAWERLFLDDRAMVISTRSYQPTQGMKRYLRARDRTCRFPGCRQPARRCQIDHTREYAKGGSTELKNLSCLCATHHALKHPDLDPRWRWHATQERDGTMVWTSPTGAVHTDSLPPRVMFVEWDAGHTGPPVRTQSAADRR